MQGTAVKEQGRQDERLGNAPLGKLIISMALPAVAAQLINVLYNIVDRIYIGHIPGQGDVALTGVGVTFPIIMLVSAFSAFAGMGGAPLASIELGKKDYEKAEKILGNSAGLIVLFSVLLTVFFMLFKTPILYAFGASEVTIGYAESYIGVYLIGTIFVQTALGLNTFISGQGASKTAMLSVLIGAVINICLDPVFIFLLGMGVKGAALATVLSQAVSAVWVARFLTSKKSVIKLRTSNMRFEAGTVKLIAALGISPFIYVGTMAIMTSVMQLVTIPLQGVTQGVQPIISYNFGAGNKKRVRSAFLRMLAITFTGMFVFCGIAVIYPSVYAGIFTSNEALTKLTVQVMPTYFLGMTIFGIQSACQATFIALGQAKVSMFIALLRKVILLIPLAIILPKYMGVMGIYRAEPVADVLSVLTTTVLFLITVKKIERKM